MRLREARRLLYASLPRLLTLRCLPGETVVGASFAENRLHLAWERWQPGNRATDPPDAPAPSLTSPGMLRLQANVLVILDVS